MTARQSIMVAACCAVFTMTSACGATEQDRIIGAEQPQPSIVEEVEEPVVPPSTSIPSAPPKVPSSTVPQEAIVDEEPPPVDESLYVNDNDPSTDIGAICWARREIVLSLADAVAPAGTEKRVEADDLPTTLNAVQAELSTVGDSLSKLPSFEFGQHLIDQVDVANQQDLRTVDASQITALGTKYFDFENYPGVEEYVKEATDSPSCSQI